MKKIEILNNQNRIYSEVSNHVICVNECHEFSIRLVFNGTEHYTIANKELSIFPENFLVINEGTVYSRKIESELAVSSFAILYTNEFLNSFNYSITSSEHVLLDEPFHVPHNISPVFPETLYPLKGDMMYNLIHIRNLFNSELNNDLLMNEYLYHCLFNFYRVYYSEIMVKSEKLNVIKIKTRNELFKRLNHAKDYMISNYNKDIQLEDICKYACLSETHFFRSFKQTFNCSPHQYLTQLRLSQAKYMLKNTNYEVREIVSLIGFDCVSTFIRLFKDRFGVTPGNYRLTIAA
ncbi:MAG TPA: AraC family transcriptional regulator [Mucilaginibacter sp.]|jgi:AraC-like DNA-binding protein|nr:AraC family transcriptional regulator [Mucilaginibacter sp.]